MILKVLNLFHVSALKKCVYNPSYVVELESIQLAKNLSYTEVPIWMVDMMDKVLSCNSQINQSLME